jgi:tRNA1(Val) A37 N6-methylase TrmN6
MIELDPRLLELAKTNVLQNKLEDRIQLVEADTDHTLPVKLLQDTQQRQVDQYGRINMRLTDNIRFDFCMCNPPFYASREEFEQGMRQKVSTPSSVSLVNVYI